VKKLVQMLVSMNKIGLIGFGGGNALIPVIQQEVVEEKGFITGEEYEKDIVAAALTPGALPVEIAAGVGKAVSGKKGMILAAIAMAFPGALMTVLLMAGMDGLNPKVLTQIQYASIGITAFIMCLLTEYIDNAFQDCVVKKHRGKAIGVCVGVFILTAGRNLFRIFQIDKTPLFSISTIEMLAIAFFAILVTDCKFQWQTMVPAGIVAGIYLLCVGKAKIIDNDIVTWTVRVVMIVLAVYSFKKSSVKKKKKRKSYDGQKISSFSDLKPGDYVVHENHGLGIYRGIEKIEVDKVTKDYMKISYADGGNLYILATQLDQIQKYASADAKKPKLNKLGGQEWHRTKSKVKTAVWQIAKDLVELYAVRQSKEGFVYEKDTVWQKEFEEMFPFEETEDQQLAIEATKRDMESPKIMDRLICGDVGFGKTEIAIRAAFKAVQENLEYILPSLEHGVRIAAGLDGECARK